MRNGIDYERRGPWPVVLLQPATFYVDQYLPSYKFVADGFTLATCGGKRITIKAGYACDGYSPVLRIKSLHIPLVPELSCGVGPAVLHDFTRQMLQLDNCPWVFEDSDRWFYNEMIACGTMKHVAGTYYAAVSGWAGKLFHRFFQTKTKNLEIIKL